MIEKVVIISLDDYEDIKLMTTQALSCIEKLDDSFYANCAADKLEEILERLKAKGQED